MNIEEIGFGAKKYKEYMFSHGRKSRSEFGDVIKTMEKEKITLKSLLVLDVEIKVYQIIIVLITGSIIGVLLK